MTSHMKKKNTSPVFPILVFLLGLASFIFSLVYLGIIDTSHFLVYTYPIGWKTYVNKTANFIFKYPPNFPVSELPRATLKQWQDFYKTTNKRFPKDTETIELINFSMDFTGNATTESYGYINVERISGVNNLDDYQTMVLDEEINNGKRFDKEYVGPNITITNVANETALLITSGRQAHSFSNPTSKYIITHNGLIYSISLEKSVLYYQNPKYFQRIYKNIVKSFRFTK